jgi:hypothetical protein
MNANAKDLLEEIGRQIDRCIFPLVKNGGFVSPRGSTVSLNILGKESYHEPERQRRSPTEPWAGVSGRQGPPGRSGATRRSWPPGETSSLLGTDDGTVYQEALRSVCEAYPGARTWKQREGFWLYSESSLIPELGRKVSFLTGVSTEKRAVRSWGFWNSGVVGATWIGPRHTNFPDGSICAYEPRDGTWAFGDSLVELLDIYSVWALRHLHFEVLGRWPGPQAVALPYERLLELADDEHCGCGSSDMRYSDCCKESDSKRDRIAEAVRFCIFTGWTLRHPPASILQFMGDRRQLPRISELV